MSARALRSPSWAALFDWDGVLVDSKALHEAAWNQTAAEFGYPHSPEDFRRHFGSQNRRVIMTLLRWTEDEPEAERIAARKEVLYRELLGDRADLWLAGSVAFVERLATLGVPRAIVSSSPRENIDVVLGRSALGSRFAAVVTAEDTRRSKPDPEGFLLGARRLGVAPERCVVFEDAPAGIEAGVRAGMHVVALTTTHAATELGLAHLITPALSADLPGQIDAWFS